MQCSNKQMMSGIPDVRMDHGVVLGMRRSVRGKVS